MRILTERDYRKETNWGARKDYYWDRVLSRHSTDLSRRKSQPEIVQPKDCKETRMKKTEQRSPRNPEDSKNIVTGVLGVRERERNRKVSDGWNKDESLPGSSLISSIAVSALFSLWCLPLSCVLTAESPCFPWGARGWPLAVWGLLTALPGESGPPPPSLCIPHPSPLPPLSLDAYVWTISCFLWQGWLSLLRIHSYL